MRKNSKFTNCRKKYKTSDAEFVNLTLKHVFREVGVLLFLRIEKRDEKTETEILLYVYLERKV